MSTLFGSINVEGLANEFTPVGDKNMLKDYMIEIGNLTTSNDLLSIGFVILRLFGFYYSSSIWFYYSSSIKVLLVFYEF